MQSNVSDSFVISVEYELNNGTKEKKYISKSLQYTDKLSYLRDIIGEGDVVKESFTAIVKSS